MAVQTLDRLPAIDSMGDLNVIIETMQGSRNKYKYDPESNCIKLSHVLTEGAVFPFDFGFIPSTSGGDGDPLDVLVLIDHPAVAGCLVKCRLIGAITAEQTVDRKTTRNDRLIGVALQSPRYKHINSLKDLETTLLDQIEHFFISYNIPRGRKFRVIRRIGPKQAMKLVQKGISG
jgi:inorganic pyrophosphatase